MFGSCGNLRSLWQLFLKECAVERHPTVYQPSPTSDQAKLSIVSTSSRHWMSVARSSNTILSRRITVHTLPSHSALAGNLLTQSPDGLCSSE